MSTGEIRFWGSGALNIDYFYEVEDLRRFSVGKRPLIPGGEVWCSRKELERLRKDLEQEAKFLGRCGGGSAANTIYALKNWGFPCGFIGLVGNDQEGDLALAELEGIDLSHIWRKGQTSCSLILLDHKKDRTIVVSPHTDEKSLVYQPIPMVKGWLHLSSFVSKEGLSFHCALVQRHQGPISFDPGEIYASWGLRSLNPILARTFYLFITKQELSILKTSPEKLSQQGINSIFIKKGAEGAQLWQKGQTKSIPSFRVSEIRDNTGAGDVFDAGVLAALAAGLTVEKAAHVGVKLAALSLRDYGRKGIPSYQEFKQALKEYTS